MKKLVEKINSQIADFQLNLTKNLNGNKSAGVRARKISLELDDLLKEYRRRSIEADKA